MEGISVPVLSRDFCFGDTSMTIDCIWGTVVIDG